MALTKEHAGLAGIYAIQHVLSGMRYIGSTSNFSIRWKGHRTLLRSGKHGNAHLQAAWNKYGEDAFDFRVVEVVADASTLLSREAHWFEVTQCCDRQRGYNIAIDPMARRWSDEQKAALSASTKGRPGRRHTAESRALMSAQRKGRRVYVMGDETREKLSRAHTGKTYTAETKDRISKAKRAFDEEGIRIIREALSMGWLIEHLALDMGVGRQVISKIKHGRGAYVFDA